jgi:hypothetical protein
MDWLEADSVGTSQHQHDPANQIRPPMENED